MAEILINTREEAGSQMCNSTPGIDTTSESEICSMESEYDKSNQRKNSSDISTMGSIDNAPANKNESLTKATSAVSSITELYGNKETTFDDPSWLQGLLQGEMENEIPVDNGTEEFIPSSISTTKRFLYCYISDNGKNTNDQNDAEVDIEESVCYLTACLLGNCYVNKFYMGTLNV